MYVACVWSVDSLYPQVKLQFRRMRHEEGAFCGSWPYKGDMFQHTEAVKASEMCYKKMLMKVWKEGENT
jgi:hypothetical protein